jgi:hypothetical protein
MADIPSSHSSLTKVTPCRSQMPTVHATDLGSSLRNHPTKFCSNEQAILPLAAQVLSITTWGPQSRQETCYRSANLVAVVRFPYHNPAMPSVGRYGFVSSVVGCDQLLLTSLTRMGQTAVVFKMFILIELWCGWWAQDFFSEFVQRERFNSF